MSSIIVFCMIHPNAWRKKALCITDDIRDVEPVGEAARGAVRRVVDAVGRRVGARRRKEVVVVAIVDE
jgi:hypothetical protein